MDITGKIIKNLIPSEPVLITRIQNLGQMISVTYTGINTKKVNTKVLATDALAKLEIVAQEGVFSFDGDPDKFLLFAEAERIQSAFQFDPIFAVNCSIVDPLPHQVEAVYKYLLPLPKIRFLLADDTGAGKTIMTGLLLKELEMRGLVERILIITPGGLTKQWQEDELYLKFNMTFKLVNRAVFESDPAIFSSSNKIITSIDFIRNEDVLNVIKETPWDIIIVDEAHKLSAFDYGRKQYRSKRYQALSSLKSEHLLLLTATPHRGRRDTFKNLLQLLDEDIFASDSLVTSRIKEISENGINKFFIRRLKEQMRDWEGKPLFKNRHTKTVCYELTPEEKNLYDKVTDYLTKRRAEANQESNIHVSLALLVMQRRLTSSIYAIMKTLKNRYTALNGLLQELAQNPNLWKQKARIDLEFDSLDDFDEFDDQERESLESILSDPRKFRLFTTAKSIAEIRNETEQVKNLLVLAESLHNSNLEEQKFKELSRHLASEGVLDGKEKLVIFTEHKDTLDYLEQRLRNNGYKIVTIHGGKNVEERRTAQTIFAREAQILIATDAAGEGINLQFCRLLINWDIPWNPNRLEQRMGRIHRYGQKEDVVVLNLVAQNTREGKVLGRLLEKLDAIRDQIGDDRVYDVISDIFEEVSLDDIINSTLNGQYTKYDDAIDQTLNPNKIREKIQEQKQAIGHSLVDYQQARLLKEKSDEKRLQPIYIRTFFEKAFKALGGTFTEVRKYIYRIDKIPDSVSRIMKEDYNIRPEVREVLFCFDKQIFLDYQNMADLGRVHYINPGNPVFDSVVKNIRTAFREDMLRGAILVSPEDHTDFFAWFIKSQITDERSLKEQENIVDEELLLLVGRDGDDWEKTSPAKLLDAWPPLAFAKTVTPPKQQTSDAVKEWIFQNVTLPQFAETKSRVDQDIVVRTAYLEEAFSNMILDLTATINELQSGLLLGDHRNQEKIVKKQEQIEMLKIRKMDRIRKLEQMQQLGIKEPEVLGCAYFVPLNQVEYQSQYGMSRDDEAEATAMSVAMNYETSQDFRPEDVSSQNLGYDIRSIALDLRKRYIEVKGRSHEGGIMLTENEMNRLAQLADTAWLYIVIHCKTNPQLYRIQNPAASLRFEIKSKGVQYFVHSNEWQAKAVC